MHRQNDLGVQEHLALDDKTAWNQGSNPATGWNGADSPGKEPSHTQTSSNSSDFAMTPEEWVCPMLGVDPDTFNHDTEEFSAIAATLMRHNAISNTLSTKPESFEPLFLRKPDGEVDARPWCMGFTPS